MLAARAHGTVPFEEVGGDLLQTVVILHEPGGRANRPSGSGTCGSSCSTATTGEATFDFALEAWRKKDGLLAVFGYDTAVLRAETVEELSRRFTLLAGGRRGRPWQPISRLPLGVGEPQVQEERTAEPASRSRQVRRDRADLR